MQEMLCCPAGTTYLLCQAFISTLFGTFLLFPIFSLTNIIVYQGSFLYKVDRKDLPIIRVVQLFVGDQLKEKFTKIGECHNVVGWAGSWFYRIHLMSSLCRCGS